MMLNRGNRSRQTALKGFGRGLGRALVLISLLSGLWLFSTTASSQEAPGESQSEQESESDVFVPTEEVSADRSVSFPTDI